MKYLKKFETFTTDDNRGDSSSSPEMNPKLKLDVTNFVTDSLNSPEFHKIFQAVGEKIPTHLQGPEFDQKVEEVKEKAIKHFLKNPEEMKGSKDVEFRRIPMGAGDGIARTNNIGGSSQANSTHIGESFKPGPREEGCDKMDITKDQAKLFRTESGLYRLIANNKITLYKDQVWYDSKDQKTIDRLNMYFKNDEDEDIED